MDILTPNQAAARWAGDLPAGSDELALWDAILAGAEDSRYTGLILGARELAAGDGAVSAGQPVFEYEDGAITGRWVTLRAERGTLVWVVMGPGASRDPACPKGTFASVEAAMEKTRDSQGRPLDWTGPHPDGIWRAGSARHGRWIMFPSIVQEG
jgi:hypothetical protein